MGKARLHQANHVDGDGAGPPQEGIKLPPLRVSGVVLRKADLLEALRIYVPALADIRVAEDGEHFWLMLDTAPRSADGDSPS